MSWFVSAVGRFPWWGWAISVCLIGGGLFLAFGAEHRPPPVDRGFQNASFDTRAEKARTQTQFEAILGPPGDYSTLDLDYIGFHSGPWPTGRRVEWKDDFAIVHVYFDRDGDRNYWRVDRVINQSWGHRRWVFFFDR